VAEAIPNARFVEIRGEDSMAWLGDADALIGEIEEFLTGSRTPVPCHSELAAILFTDIVGSTKLAARLHHDQWQILLGQHNEAVRREIQFGGGRVIKAIGDGFLATFPTPDLAVRAAGGAIHAALALGLELRAGIHVGIVEKLANDVRGIAVHIAARVSEAATAGQVVVSGTTRDMLIDSELELLPLAPRALRGVPGEWSLYQAQVPGTEATPPAAREAAGL
jgi:class 3 adenylate cyclase